MKRLLRTALAVLSSAAVVATVLALFGVTPAGAAGGDIQSIDFAAEDPDEYDHATGGGFYGSDSDGDGKETVESLQGGDFACGDLVSFFVALNVEGGGTDDPQTIQLTNTFLADATGQTGAGLTDVVNVLIDPADPAQNNDGDSTLIIIDEGIDANGAAPYANDGQKLAGGGDSTYVTYQVDGLETGETVIVRIDVQIECAANTSPTGNLQGNLTEADIVAINDGTPIDPPDAVAGGNQTIPFQKVGELVGAGEPLLDIQKTVMAAGGTCGLDDVETLDITIGDTVTYCYLVTNDGTADLANTVITDDNGTPADTGDDFTVTVGTVPAISSVYVTADVTIDETGTIVNTATAIGDGPQNTTLTDSDTATVVAAGTPSLAVDKVFNGIVDNDASDGDTAAELGETLSYTITATNDGDVPLTNVVVSDDLTATSTTCASLAPGETCVLPVIYVVQSGDVATGSVANTGTADSDETNPVEDTVTVPVASNPALAVDKMLVSNADEDGSGTVSVDDTLTYTVTATNTGDVPLTSVTVSDDLTGDSTACATVAVGDDCVLTVTHKVTQVDVDAGQIVNTGTGDSDQTGPVDDTETVTIEQTFAIELSKNGTLDLGDDGVATPGDVIEYTITATNTGNVTVTGVSVSDPDVDDLVCDAEILAPLASTTCTATHTLTQADIDAGSYTNTASVTTDQGTTDDDDHTETIPPAPSIAVDKALLSNADEDGSGTVSLGDTLTYTVTATNTGNTTLQITVSDDLTAASTSCADVLPGETCKLTTLYTVTQADVDAGEIVNTGTGGSDQTDPVDDPETVDVPQVADIDLEKSGVLNDGGDGVANVGDSIDYTLTVTNTGNVTLTDVVVTDDMLGGTVCTVESMAPDAIETCTSTYTLTQADIDAGGVDNVALAEGTPPEGAPPVTDADGDGNPDDPGASTVDIPEFPAIDLTKSGSLDLGADGVANPGDVIGYTLVVTNTGNVTLGDVDVIDTMLGGIVCDFDSLAVGAIETCTGSYVLTQADIDAGQVANTATADGTSPQGTEVDDQGTHTEDVPQIVTLAIDKQTNGADDNTILVGSEVTWSYQVTNTGNVTLDNLSVADSDPSVTVTCPADVLAPGESTTCTASGTAVADGYTNTGTADADGPQDQAATGSDDSGYFGADPAVSIVKQTVSAEGTGDGVLAGTGDVITWTYEVTNTGNVDLTGIVVSDDREGVICTVDLVAGQSDTCTWDGTAGSGAYSNTGTSSTSYTDDLGNSTDVSDSDYSGYYGLTRAQPSIQFTEGTFVVTPAGNDGFDATVNVTNESDELEADEVAITSFEVTAVKIGKGKQPDTEVDVVCTVNGQATGDPMADPIIFGAETDLDIGCTTADGSRLNGQYEITIETKIFNRDNTFTERTRVRF